MDNLRAAFGGHSQGGDTMTKREPAEALESATPGDPRLFFAATQRNCGPITDLVRRHAPASGSALEIASGTGQHAVALAEAIPGVTWQPSDPDPAHRASIDARAAAAGLGNLLPAIALDAAEPGWSSKLGGRSLVLLVNLLHLITGPEADTVIREAAAALAPNGQFILYGPFLRGGRTTSDGDSRFHAELQDRDPAIGYKNDADIADRLADAGLSLLGTVEMPANNLAFVSARNGSISLG